MICKKCGYKKEPKDFTDTDRIEEHHNPPQFMLENWKGELIDLCNHCHIEILHPLILEIIKKHSNLLSNRNNSAFWIWKYHVLYENKQKCIDEIIKFTKGWLKEDENTTTA